MKRLLSVLIAVLAVIFLAGCSDAPAADNPSTEPTNTTAGMVEKPELTDYSVTGMMNVTSTYFCTKDGRGPYYEVDPAEGTATAVCVWVMCPYCSEETFDIVEFSEISETLIGQQTFTWTNEVDCGNWDNHRDRFTYEYNYSIIFALNG